MTFTKLTVTVKSTGEEKILYDGKEFQNFEWLAAIVGGSNSDNYINLNDDLMDGPLAMGETFTHEIWGSGLEPVEVLEFHYELSAGAKLKKRRKECGLRQADLSELSGVSVRTIQHYEQGTKDLNKAAAISVKKLADALGCRIDDLLTDEA